MLNKTQLHKDVWRSGGMAARIIDLVTTQMGTNGQLHAPAILTSKRQLPLDVPQSVPGSYSVVQPRYVCGS